MLERGMKNKTMNINIINMMTHLSGDSDVGEGDASPRRVPFGDVEKPLGGRAGLEEVAEETSNLEGGALWNMRRTIVV